MIATIRSLAPVTLCAVLLGCGGAPSYEGPQRYPLTGKVTLDGQPVDGGSISFISVESDGRPAGGAITGGGYSVPEEQGAPAGTYRVEVRWPKPTGKKVRDSDTGEMIDRVAEAVPPRYNVQSELTAEVSETQTNFDFDLKSK